MHHHARSDTLLPNASTTAGATSPLPGIYFIHGGGMVMGSIRNDATATMLCDEIGAAVVSVEYRLAPEHPYPAPVEDCYAGLVWMEKNASELGIDPDPLLSTAEAPAAASPSPSRCSPGTASGRH